MRCGERFGLLPSSSVDNSGQGFPPNPQDNCYQPLRRFKLPVLNEKKDYSILLHDEKNWLHQIRFKFFRPIRIPLQWETKAFERWRPARMCDKDTRGSSF